MIKKQLNLCERNTIEKTSFTSMFDVYITLIDHVKLTINNNHFIFTTALLGLYSEERLIYFYEANNIQK